MATYSIIAALLEVSLIHVTLAAHGVSMQKQSIKLEGWHDWGKIDAHDTVYFAEYKNYGPGAAGARPSWTHTLTDTEAENYTYASVFN